MPASTHTSSARVSRVRIKPEVAQNIPPGTGVDIVAKTLGVPYHIAYQFMVRHGIPRAKTGPRGPRGPRDVGYGNRSKWLGGTILDDIRTSGLTLQDIGTKYNLTRERVRQIAVEHGIQRKDVFSIRRQRHVGDYVHWSSSDTSRLRSLHALGMSMSEIGRLLKRSKGSVIGKVHRLNLPKRPHIIKRAA